MATVQFDRDSMAKWYATQQLKVDPGVREVHYLPAGAPDREIRLLVVNDLIIEMRDESLEPLDFGVDIGAAEEHKLYVLDVTPRQWESMARGELHPPEGWDPSGAIVFKRGRRK